MHKINLKFLIIGLLTVSSGQELSCKIKPNRHNFTITPEIAAMLLVNIPAIIITANSVTASSQLLKLPKKSDRADNKDLSLRKSSTKYDKHFGASRQNYNTGKGKTA